MNNLELTNNELYFLLVVMRKLSGEYIHNKYPKGILSKVEKLFEEKLPKVNNIEAFTYEFTSYWVGQKENN